MNSQNYFELRNIQPEFYSNYKIPQYILKLLPKDRNIPIMDIGCGYGQFLLALRDLGYKNLTGIDINENAIQFCLKNDLHVELIEDLKNFSITSKKKFDLMIMNHVLEHIAKDNIISTLKVIRECLLNKNGVLIVIVPNAQANTSAYWAFEDFTHTTIFTSGSLFYVLKSAGFEFIELIDIDCTDGLTSPIKHIKIFFLMLFKLNRWFWNWVTSSSYHRQSPNVFSYEIKVLAK
jgi:predicted TPR repeat methyltransferase